jgi:hypothetical protein
MRHNIIQQLIIQGRPLAKLSPNANPGRDDIIHFPWQLEQI